MVDAGEHVKQLFTHREVIETGHHIRVLCGGSELRKDGQDKYYYTNNRCDITRWVIVLEDCRDLQEQVFVEFTVSQLYGCFLLIN